jgi:hypothetical protein
MQTLYEPTMEKNREKLKETLIDAENNRWNISCCFLRHMKLALHVPASIQPIDIADVFWSTLRHQDIP